MPGAPFFPETTVDVAGALTHEEARKFRAIIDEIRLDPTLDTALQKAIGCCFSSAATSSSLCVALRKYFETVSDTGRLCHRAGIAIANQREMEKAHAEQNIRCEAQSRKIVALERELPQTAPRSPRPSRGARRRRRQPQSPAPAAAERHGMWGTQPVAYIEPQQGHTVVRKLGAARFSPTDLCLAPVSEITHLPRKRRRRTVGGE